VVGNLIVGGAGKTPTVLALVSMLRQAGWRPGIISRGYGRRDESSLREIQREDQAADVGDEPLLLHRRSGVPVVVGRDRAAAARQLRTAHPDVDIVVSDDGLQHLALHRDLELIVFDERGIGNGWLLPAGPLREPFAARPGERQMVIYNAPAPSTPWPGHLARRRLGGAVDLPAWWAGEPGDAARLDDLRGRQVVAAAGMAYPTRFFDMLRARGLQIDPLPLPDHFDFARLPWPEGTPEVLLTEKDAVKLAPERMGRTRVWVVTLDFDVDPGFKRQLLSSLPTAPVAAAQGKSC
jgi:tetraacyldisaccharide 4'-kinase